VKYLVIQESKSFSEEEKNVPAPAAFEDLSDSSRDDPPRVRVGMRPAPEKLRRTTTTITTTRAFKQRTL